MLCRKLRGERVLAETIRASVRRKQRHNGTNNKDDVKTVQRQLAAAINVSWLGSLPPGAISNFSAYPVTGPSRRV
ncbi:hypothetical protein AB1K70_17655 [Bremerella sp. JC770]|uniref:hypothetical protein n=1 Tax=Bremerella sp. JC770 TaxID=3232137 RepID=UPI0034575B83